MQVGDIYFIDKNDSMNYLNADHYLLVMIHDYDSQTDTFETIIIDCNYYWSYSGDVRWYKTAEFKDFYNATEELRNPGKKICRCDIRDLMVIGCKCGGV